MRRLTALAACGLLLWGAAGRADNEEAKLKQSTQQLEKMQSRIKALDQALAESRGHRDALVSEIEATEARLDQLKQDLAQRQAATAQKSSALRKTRAERAAVEQKLAAQQSLLARQIRAAYLVGRRGPEKLVLRQDDGARMQRLLTDFDYFNRARVAVIESIRSQRAALVELEQRQQAQSSELKTAQAEQERVIAQLAGARAQRLEALDKLKKRIAGGESELQQLKGDEQQLVGLIAKLKDLLAEIPPGFHGDQPLGKQKGRLPWPSRGRLLARYGSAKAEGKLKWSGIWIAAPEGAPVRAVANGRVAYVGRLQRFGLLAVVEHSDGYFTLYGHSAEVLKSAGDRVRAGEVIAHAGTSGGHEQPGVYFELRKGSQAVDPMEWLGK
jgi:septal ring factor EnvC (AmiA/AmiB activator)